MSSYHLHPSSIPNSVSETPIRERLDFPLSLGATDALQTNHQWQHLNVASSRNSSKAQPRIRHRTLKGLTNRGRGHVSIDVLPDDVLLEIFNIYVNEGTRTEEWHALVHVCRRWRYIVFASPCRLHLRLLCTTRTPVRARLGVWPAFPIVISGIVGSTSPVENADNILAALEHRDRVCHISLQHIPNTILRTLAEVMNEPFQSLTFLELRSNDESTPGLPDSFLGGSAPRLQRLRLVGIPFLALSKLLLSTGNLVNLDLVDIPHSGYISPQTMVTCLSALTRLDTLQLRFRSPLSRPDRATRRPSRLTRVVFPTLSTLCFKGVSEYFEDLVAQIDAPLLNQIWIEYFHQLLFDTSQLLQFVCRTNELKKPDQADILFRHDHVRIILYSQRPMVERRILGLSILCRESEWQVSSLAQFCSVFLPPLSPTLERLDIHEDTLRPHWHGDMENVQWLELLQPFTAVKDLYLSSGLASRVPPVLQELALEGLTEVLPALQNIFTEEPQPSGSIHAVRHGEVRRHEATFGSPSRCPPLVETDTGNGHIEWSAVND